MSGAGIQTQDLLGFIRPKMSNENILIEDSVFANLAMTRAATAEATRLLRAVNRFFLEYNNFFLWDIKEEEKCLSHLDTTLFSYFEANETFLTAN